MEYGWKRLEIAGPHQDVFGWTNPETNEYFEPTYSWLFKLIAERSDGTLFYVNVSIPEKEWEGVREDAGNVLTMRLQQAFLLLEEFRVCDCTAHKRCNQHPSAGGVRPADSE